MGLIKKSKWLTGKLGLCRKRQVSLASNLNDRTNMNTQPASSLARSKISLRLGLCAAVLATTAAMTPEAHAVVVTFSTPIAVPNTFAGVYINLLTGANGITPASVPGWDIGPWGSSNTLTFFFNGTPANSSGGVAATTTGPYLDLAVGSVISSASTFSASASNLQTAAFQSSGTHRLGFRFFNETTSAVNYGYMTLQTTGPLGFPATVTGWSFENSGAAITVVPEPSTTLMLALGGLALGAAQLRRSRRERLSA